MKKLVYTLGTIAAVATPLVAVVSCGSNKGNGTSLPTLEKGEYPNQDWFDKVSNNQIQMGEKLISNGEDLGFRYQVVTDDEKISGATDFSAQEMKELVKRAFDFAASNSQEQRLAFKSALEKSFQFFYIQIINPKTHKMSATKTIYLPHLSSSVTDAEKTVYESLFDNEKISSNPKEIPVTAYDAPSVMNMALTVTPTDTHVARIYTNGQRYPQLDKDLHLSDRVIEKFLTSTLKSDSVSGSDTGVLGSYETEFHTSFTNELYLSQITSALHVYRDNLPTWILRAASMVGDNAENGFTVPYGHLPQNPMDFNRLLSSLTTSLKAVKFVPADENASIDVRTLGNGVQVYALSKIFDELHLDQDGKISKDMADQIADAFVENEYVKSESQYAPFDVAVNISSIKDINNAIEMFKTKLKSTDAADADYKEIFANDKYAIKAKNSVYVDALGKTVDAGTYVAIDKAVTAWNWSENFDLYDVVKVKNDTVTTENFNEEELMLYKAYVQIATKWWTDGSSADKAKNITFGEITSAVLKTDASSTPTDFALKQLFEWSVRDQFTQTSSLWWNENQRVNFQITHSDIEDKSALVQKLMNFKFEKTTKVAL